MHPHCCIAIIEDDEGIRESVKDALEIEGYCVRTFVNGRDAMERLPQGKLPALILLDLMMPVMDGWKFMETQKQLEGEYARTPVFVVSAVADPVKVKDAGAAGYIRKPLDLDVLLRVVESYCQHPPS